MQCAPTVRGAGEKYLRPGWLQSGKGRNGVLLVTGLDSVKRFGSALA